MTKLGELADGLTRTQVVIRAEHVLDGAPNRGLLSGPFPGFGSCRVEDGAFG